MTIRVYNAKNSKGVVILTEISPKLDD